MTKKLTPMVICYDFDGTLSPGNMQEYDFMNALGIDSPKDFWVKSNGLAKEQQGDEVSAYMYMMLKETRNKDLPFKRETLNNYGKNITLFPGVEGWFSRVNEYAATKGIDLKHYIISSGLKEIVEGTKIASEFTQIFASSFMYDANGVAYWPAIVLNYTSKTQYLFRINKGCEDISDNKLINSYSDPDNRPVPFSSMVYIGDGDTDVPCMKIIKNEKGHSIAVYKHDDLFAKEKVQGLIDGDRVNISAPADYSEGSVIDIYVKAIIDKLAADSALKSLEE